MTPRCTSSWLKRSERISLRRIPVEIANSATSWRLGLHDVLHATSRRAQSSSQRKRSRPRGSLSLRSLCAVLVSSHSHSRTATLRTWDSAAIYRLAVAGPRARLLRLGCLRSFSRATEITPAVTSARRRWPSSVRHQASWRAGALGTWPCAVCGEVPR